MPKWTQTREEQHLEENQSCLGDAETEDSSSSYSLQECIDELQARRIRRFSTQSRDVQHAEQIIEQGIGDGPHKDDVDLINQNRHNKEQERKCKPCKNGYCYCFTSDSGESGKYRQQQRRARKTENNLLPIVSPSKMRQSLPAMKLNAAKDSVKSSPVKKQQEVAAVAQQTQLTAISRLESAPENAPLIHIIQELRNNCVVSEVRVNRHKIQGTRSANPSPEKPPRFLSNAINKKQEHAPSAPSLNKINEVEHSCSTRGDLICSSSSLESSLRSNSNRMRHEHAGRLLQKRLKQLPVQHQRHNKPPPKPPRAQALAASVSTLSSSSPSVRAAESILDEFLRNRGVAVNESKGRATTNKRTKVVATQTAPDVHVKRDQRKSFPLTVHRKEDRPLPSCPSLSDLERVVDETKKSHSHYDKNLKKQQKNDKSPIKEISFGWAEPKIAHMLQARKEYKSQAVQAGPQSVIGWQKPKPYKIDLDVVDGVRQNLAINIGNKKTPIKQTERFIWGEQLLGQSPWAKSNLKCSQFSRDLLQKSKKRILRLVSPKKHNKTTPNIILQRSVAVQTVCDDFIVCKHSSASPNSAPGCYQSNTNLSLVSPNDSQQNSEQTQFDFSRVISSPRNTKKATRKLNFSPKTYRSFQTDIDQDVSFARMGYILSNIKAKLEASDEHAVRTFQEIERADQQNIGYDEIDASICATNNVSPELVHKTNAEIHNDVVVLYKRAATAPEHHEPIYSEIEEDSLLISGSPRQENKAGVHHHIITKTDPNALYAQVNKSTKLLAASTSTAVPPMALGQFLQNSLRTLPSISEAPMLTTTTEPPLASSECSSMPSQQFMNNMQQQQLSKSDLSLQRSEIFLDNLCRSELQLEKNNNLEQSFASSSVSYEMPDNDINYESAQSLQQNHSTPKKLESEHSMSPEVFMTKTYMSDDTRQQLEMHAVPNTKNRTPTDYSAHSFDSNLTRCKRIKNILRRSLRKSCNLIKFVDTTRLSKSLNLPTSHSSPMRLETSASLNDAPFNDIDMEAVYCFASSYHLDTLFHLDDDTPVEQQIAQAVAICRQLPALEVSAEMVEAERLLLCSTLRQRQQEKILTTQLIDNSITKCRYFIDGLRLPVRENPSQDIFFNYFYIVTIMCDGVLRSTQSVECCNKEAIFKDCAIEFNCSSLHNEQILQAEIFMLRLRKVSTLSLEPLKPLVKLPTKNNASCGSSSNDEIVSRFRLHGSFTLQARDLVPFEYVDGETCRSDSICLRTAKSCLVSLQKKNKSSNLVNNIRVFARCEARFPKYKHSGLLNMQETTSLHHWNQRWCILDGIYMNVWRDANHIEKQPMLQLDLRQNFHMNFKLPLTECAREICARQRSFCLQYAVNKTEEEAENLTAVFFAAETQIDLNLWLQYLNATLQLIADWMI